MTSAISSFGTLLKMGDGATPTETFTTIAELTDIGGPSLSADPIDVTSHDSANRYREFIQGLKDGGEVSIEANYIPTDSTHNATTGILKDFNDGTLRNFKLVFPDAGNTTWSFSAIVTSFEPSMPIDGQLTFSSTLKISGTPTLA